MHNAAARKSASRDARSRGYARTCARARVHVRDLVGGYEVPGPDEVPEDVRGGEGRVAATLASGIGSRGAASRT